MLRLLMVRPWLFAGRDDAAISAVRRNEQVVRETFARLGWVIVVAPGFVRLRKTPPTHSGVDDSGALSAAVCRWLFLLVAGAESLGRRVGLSSLADAARLAAAEAGVPTTGEHSERRAMVNALRLLYDRGVMVELDGDTDRFVDDEGVAVLVEIHHDRLLQVVANYAEIDPSSDPEGWLSSVRREREPARRMRRKLLDGPVVHVSDLDADEADWLSRRVRGDDGGPLAAAFGLHVERRAEGAAFTVPDDAFQHSWELGPNHFPGQNTAAHAALLICDWAARVGHPDPFQPGWFNVATRDVGARLTWLAEQQPVGRGGWANELAADPTGRLMPAVRSLLRGLELVQADDEAWRFSPATRRWERPPALNGSVPEGTDCDAVR